MFQWFDWCGYVGLLLVFLAFFLLQAKKLKGHGIIYQLMNALGGLGLVLSLGLGRFVLPLFVWIILSVLWVVIAVYGIVFSRRERRSGRYKTDTGASENK